MKLTVIGCGDAFGSGGRLNTCFYLTSPNGNFLIDCGATTLVGLQRSQINLDEIEGIIVSHFHGDHYGGIPFLLMDAMAHHRTKPLTIVSPPGGEERIRMLTDQLYPSSDPIGRLKVNFISYTAYEPLYTSFCTVEAFPVLHTEAALPHGLRIQVNEKIIAYSGDTRWTDELIALSDNADVFICECNFYHTENKNHLHYTLLREKLSQFNFKNIYLTHLDNEMLDRIDLVRLPMLHDGYVIEI